MGIDWFRDLIICIWGCLAIIFLIVVAILVLMLSKRLQNIMDSIDLICCKGNSILESLEVSTSNFEDIVADIRNKIMNPLIQITAVVKVIQQLMGMLNHLKKRGKRQEDG